LETLDILGKAYLRIKNYKALASVFERIMKLNPNSATAHIMMGTAYDEMSNRADSSSDASVMRTTSRSSALTSVPGIGSSLRNGNQVLLRQGGTIFVGRLGSFRREGDGFP
jgi:hypothetical protein